MFYLFLAKKVGIKLINLEKMCIIFIGLLSKLKLFSLKRLKICSLFFFKIFFNSVSDLGT